ncbi:MAG: UTP--glucose-1-phosphate uridylyltransferase [Spirochaetes bacterium]|nr:UTP--glucose-1-phosphate uridylyltransferase [Spirochaetota bacterium]
MASGRNNHETVLFRTLRERGQDHLLRFWDVLSERERDMLVADLDRLDFELIDRFQEITQKESYNGGDLSLPSIITVPDTKARREKEKSAFDAGCGLLRGSKLAVFTAAGGQSSRLGLDSPKGTFPVTPVRRKSLFQVLAEKILYMQNRFAVRIPWVIMVSSTNRDQTIAFFESNRFFGLTPDLIRFIEQEEFASFDVSGKIFLREKHRVFMNPSGHGGTFSALKNSGALAWLSGLGAEEIFYSQVDNVLVKVLDPVFVGYHALSGSDMSSKCVMKKDPKEKVGVFICENGKTAVIEYTELETLSGLKNGLRPELFKAGSIAIHMINVRFAEKLVSGGSRLPLHRAHKAIAHIGMDGDKVSPESPNGYKIEMFIFDALKAAGNSVVMEVLREEEFSPLKNKSGDASPQSVEKDQVFFYSGWLEEAGIEVPKHADGSPKYRVEVSPLYAAMKDDFLSKTKKEIVLRGDTYIE